MIINNIFHSCWIQTIHLGLASWEAYVLLRLILNPSHTKKTAPWKLKNRHFHVFLLKKLPESGPATNAGNFDDLAPKLLRRCLRFLPLRFCSVQEHKSRGGCVLPPIESPRDHIPTPTNIFIDLFDFRRSVSKIQGTFFKKWMVGETTIAGCNPNHLSWENSHETSGTQQ